MKQILQDVVSHIAKQRDEAGSIGFSFLKKYKPDNESPLRPSSAGKCARQIGFKILKPDLATPIMDRGTSGFLHGDILHDAERYLIGQVADLRMVEHKLKNTIRWEKEEMDISGSVDGVIFENDKPKHILDIKSTNDRSFNDMCRYGADPGYVGQLQIYMWMSGIEDAWLWLYNKNDTAFSSVPHPTVTTIAQRAVIHVPYSEAVAVKHVARLYSIFISTQKGILPDRDHTFVAEIKNKKETGRDYLPWHCSYCQFTGPCWSSLGFEMVFEKGKPRWIRDRNKLATDEELEDILSPE